MRLGVKRTLGFLLLTWAISLVAATAASALEIDMRPATSGSGIDVYSTQEIARPSAEVMKVLRKLQDYPQFIPDMREMQVLEDRGDYVRARIIQGLFYFGTATFTLEARVLAADRFTIDTLDGPLKKYNGSFLLTPLAQNQQVVLHAYHHLEGPFWLPNFVLRTIARQGITGFLEGVKKQAERS
jgi:ribosome-associated toxin RatA of RatAB toxin-antitoxin module